MYGWRSLALFLLACVISACGGGGGGSPSPATPPVTSPPPSNPPPSNPPPSNPPANAAPTAANDSYTALRDTALTIAAPGVLGNDTDPTTEPLTAKLGNNVTHGTLSLQSNGSFTYTPAAGY